MTSREFKYHFKVRVRKDYYYDFNLRQIIHKRVVVVKKRTKDDRIFERRLNTAFVSVTTPNIFDCERMDLKFDDEPKQYIVPK